MPSKATRREVLKQIGAASVGFAAAPVVRRGQRTPITVAGQSVEIIVSSVNSSTVRLTVAAVDGPPVHDDGALVRAAEAPVLTRGRDEFGPIKAGDLTVRATAARSRYA